MLPRRKPHNIRTKRQVKTEKPVKTARSRFWNGSIDWGRVRLWGVGIFFTLLWLCLWGRAFQLQIIQGPTLAAMAKRQQTATEVLHGVRGSIVDRHGNVMARSVDCRSVWVNPAQIADKQGTASALSRILGMPASKVLAVLQEDKRYVWLMRKLDYETAEKVKAAALPGVNLATEFERVYPYKGLAGQLLGFVNVDDQGIEGLEKAFENTLGGARLRRPVERDAAGRRMVLPGSEGLVDLRGKDVRLTIDTQVQFFAEEALAENVEKYAATWGGCLVVDVPTGEILAWAQYPFFDPNNAARYSGAVRRNRIAMDALEQGSTIKSFLVAAALEEKVVTPSTVINCEKGAWKLRSATIHDTHSYASLPVEKVLHVSSNIGAAKIGLKLGVTKYRDYLMRLGFGERSGLPLAGEATGILRTTRKWTDLDLATASFGQSFSATLLQMAQAYLCLASDGEKRTLRLILEDEGHEPHAEAGHEGETAAQGDDPVVQNAHEASPQTEKIFSPATMRQIRAMLREVVEEEGGTGAQARIPGMVVGGKTGTAQKADRSGRYGSGRVGSFVGMIPIEEPRYLVCVLLDEPTRNQYGGVVAAPVFRHVALRTMAYHGLLPDSDDPLVIAAAEKEAARKARAEGRKYVPKAVQQAAAAKAAAAKAAAGQDTKPGQKTALAVAGGKKGASAKSAGEGAADARQTGAAASQEQSGGRQMEQTAGERAVTVAQNVPGVVGMGVRSAVEILAAQGVVPVIKGKGGFVVRQTPDAGAAWPANKKECILWLEERAS